LNAIEVKMYDMKSEIEFKVSANVFEILSIIEEML